jgi:prepilin-type N-terminal cleavage/methylation domain-containing protein
MKRGFTLIEIMVSLSIFIIIMTVSMGSILGVFNASNKSDSLRVVMNNLNLAVETMSREIMFGKNYHCMGNGVPLLEPQNCPAGDNYFTFLSNDGHQIGYRLNPYTTPPSIEKSIDSPNGNVPFIAVTSPEVTIQSLNFYVIGAGVAPVNSIQPKVFLQIKGFAGPQQGGSSFIIETLISQRALDQ